MIVGAIHWMSPTRATPAFGGPSANHEQIPGWVAPRERTRPSFACRHLR